ncbi:MAG TPA: pitrilysin family protein, partial [Polyangiaceae bacterium]|nr:pitrilysin family protein [Polyangiaceae bacterium]
GTLSASTSVDNGNLSIAVPPENLSAVLELLADVVQNPLLSELETERGIIREEILEDLDEDGQLVDDRGLVRLLAFPDHGLGRPITGPIENLETFDLARVRSHFAKTYVASGMVLTVAGALDAERVEQEIAAAFSGVPAGSPLAFVPAAEQSERRFRMMQSAGSNQTRLSIAFRAPGEHDPLEPAVEMLLRVIDDGMSTRLYHRLCDSLGLCYDAAASYEAYDETGLVEFGTETAHERAPRVLTEILSLAEELASSGPNELELERARRRARWQHEAMLDHAGDLGDFLALGELRRVARTPHERLEHLLAVSQADVREAAQRIFGGAGRSVVAVGRAKGAALGKLERLALG